MIYRKHPHALRGSTEAPRGVTPAALAGGRPQRAFAVSDPIWTSYGTTEISLAFLVAVVIDYDNDHDWKR